MQSSSLDLRQYAFILRRRWVLSSACFLVVLALGVAYCFFWPKTYEATALVVVQPQKVPGNIVKATITTKIEERLQIITQQVLSRSRLTEIIERFSLYPAIRAKMAPDELAEEMRNQITIKITRKNYFTITFIYRDPNKVAEVTNALAAFYVDSNIRIREQDAVGTARFLTSEVDKLREQLREKEKRITDFKEKHLHELPSEQDNNVKLLAQLENKTHSLTYFLGQERGLMKSEEAEINRITSRLEHIKIQKAELRRIGAATSGGASEGESSAKAIKEKIERLKVFYTDDHPDIIRLKRHLKKAEALEAAKKAELKAKGVNPNTQQSETDLQIGALEDQRARGAERVAQIQKRVKDLEKKRAENEARMVTVRQRIENGPEVAKQMQDLTREYDLIKKAFDRLFESQQDASMAANLERTQRGEQFEVVDPAQTPDSPFRPDVKKALPMTFALALLVAVGISFGLNYVDTSFNAVEQIEKATEFPVLVVIPPLITMGEAAANRRKQVVLGVTYSLTFLFLMGLVGILLTGKADALKEMVYNLVTFAK